MFKGISFIFLALVSLTVVTAKLEEVFKWKLTEWKWPNEQARNKAIHNGDYIPGNSMPNGILRWKDKMFVTVPRWKAGVASTLNYIPMNSTDPSPALIPYPNWESNWLTKENEKSADNITISIFRIDVDPCDRLWVLDTGLAQIHGGRKEVTRPKLVIFDLKTDKVIRRYTLKPDEYSTSSLFPNVIVDATAGKCDQAFAYIPDIENNDVIVYSFAENNSWKVKHNFFSFEPLQGDLNIAGFNFQWHDGVFSLALGPIDKNGHRTAYFHSLIGTHEFSVNTQVLKNKTLATDSVKNYHFFKVEGKKGPNTQGTSSAFDMKKEILFLSQILKDGVGCWNTKKPLNNDSFAIVAQDHKKIIFPNDIKIDEDRNLWILSDKMPFFIFEKMNPTQVNFRILKISTDDAVKGTVCES